MRLERNACSTLPAKGQRKAAGKVLQVVSMREDPAMVRAVCRAVVDAIASFSRAAAELLEDAECDKDWFCRHTIASSGLLEKLAESGVDEEVAARAERRHSGGMMQTF